MIALALGAAIGAFHGSLVAYLGIPAFIVTLGAQLFWRGAAWWVTTGQTIAPLDDRFALMGGGPHGSIGKSASWALGLLACAAIVFGLYAGRQRRGAFPFPAAADVGGDYDRGRRLPVVAGRDRGRQRLHVARARRRRIRRSQSYPRAGRRPVHFNRLCDSGADRTGDRRRNDIRRRRTRFGRYVYAIGGNPEAAELAGINTKKITVLVFALMGMLAAIAACIDSARLDSATNVLGQFDELYVIAAAVIGGTSLAGGVGTIYGAMIGALVIQSLQSGMVLLGFDSAFQQMVVGVVLVGAVGIDTFYRRRTAKG